MEFVKLNKDELKTAIELVWRVFQEFEAPCYSREGVEEYKKYLSSDVIIDRVNREEMSFWGCKDKEKLVGVLATKGVNHISMLFVDKEYHNRGISKTLIKIVKDICKRRCKIKQITVNSSPYAIDFYHKIGFSDTDHEQTVSGITFTPMICSII